MFRFILFSFVLWVGTAVMVTAAEIEVYSNDFEGVVGPEWSSAITSTTPVGARGFLGQFGAETVSLSLTGLPAHTAASIGIDLFIIGSWDGNNGFNSYGPDTFEVAISGGPVLLTTTFGVFSNPSDEQAYPDAYPGGSYPTNTGAEEVNTLGFIFVPQLMVIDAVYRLEFTLPHTDSDLEILFDGLGWCCDEGIHNESWGLDNIEVNIEVASPPDPEPIPEPSTLVLATLGLLSLGFTRRRRRRA